MKTFISMLLAVTLAVCLGGCSRTNAPSGADAQKEDSRQEAKAHKIGVAVYDVSDDEVVTFREYLTNYIKQCFPGVEFYYSHTIRSGEDEMAFLKEARAEGVQGIMSFITYDLAAEVEYCESQGIYYMLASGSVSQEQYEAVADNPYFLGIVGPGADMERQAGADMAAHFLDEMQGNSYILFTGGASIGNEMHRLRSLGALEVFEKRFGSLGKSPEELAVSKEMVKLEAGDKKLTIFPGYTSRDNVREGAVRELQSTKYDFVLSMFSMYSLADELKAAGVKQGVVDCYSETNRELFESGIMCYVAGKYSSIIGPSFAAMYNAVTGHAKEFRENGKAFRMTQGFWTARSAEEYNAMYALATGIYVNAYNYEDLGAVIKEYDGTADFGKLKKLAEAWSYEEAEARRGE